MTQFDPSMVAQMLMQPVGRESLDNSISDENFFQPIEIPSESMVAPLDMQGGFFIDPETAGKVAYGGAVTGASFIPGAGIVDAYGGAVDVTGQPLPSFSENIGQGNYLDAALQGLGVAGDVATFAAPATLGASAVLGAMLKAPRAAQKIGKATDVASDVGSIAKVEPPTETQPGIIAFHGSGADFDEFKLDKIGTGEGAQAFGYGLYFTDSEDIAKFYQTTLGKRSGFSYEGEIIPSRFNLESGSSQKDQIISSIADKMDNLDRPASFLIKSQIKSNEIELAKLKSREADELTNDIITSTENELEILKGLDADKFKRGKTYKVALEPKPEELLDYDKPLSEQSDEIKVKFINALENLENKTLNASLLNEVKVAQQKSEAVINLNKKLDNFVDELPNEKAKKIYKELIDEVFKDIPYNVKEYDLFKEFEEVVPFNKYPDIDSNIVYDIKSDLKLARPKTIGEMLPTDKITSEALSKAGIKGIKYKAEQLSGKIDSKNTNFVIFDDKLIKILEKYGIVGPVAVSATAAALRDDDGST